MKDLELLRKAVEVEGSIKAVMNKLEFDYKRHKAIFSLLLSGKYPTPEAIVPKSIYHKVNATYDYLNIKNLCPALKGEIDEEVCKKYVVAIKSDKNLGGTIFSIVKSVCPYCANFKRILNE